MDHTQETQLRDHLLRYVVPNHLAEADPSTITELLTSVSYWEQSTDFASLQSYRSAFPRFSEWLRTTPGRNGKLRSPATRRKHVCAIQMILDRAGPPTREHDGAGLIEQPIKLPMPKGGASIVKRPLTLPDLGRFLETCQTAEWDRKTLPIPACVFWRCFALFTYNAGLRIETLFALRWEWLEQDDAERWWFAIPEWAMKKTAFRCFVSAAALQAIQPLRKLHNDLVFPFPYGHNHARNKFTDLLIRAGISMKGLQANKFHALRRMCNDELVQINPYAAKLQLGHSSRDVTLNHYTSAAVLVSAHAKLPQPIWSGDFYGRQRRLF
jgi:integrase